MSWFAPCFALWWSIRLSRNFYLAFGVELYLIGAFTGVMTISWLYIDSVWLYVSICVLICGLVNILVSLLIASSFVSLAWLLLLWPDVCLGPCVKFFYFLRLNLVLLVSCFVSWLVYCSVLWVVSWCVSWLVHPPSCSVYSLCPALWPDVFLALIVSWLCLGLCLASSVVLCNLWCHGCVLIVFRLCHALRPMMSWLCLCYVSIVSWLCRRLVYWVCLDCVWICFWTLCLDRALLWDRAL